MADRIRIDMTRFDWGTGLITFPLWIEVERAEPSYCTWCRTGELRDDLIATLQPRDVPDSPTWWVSRCPNHQESWEQDKARVIAEWEASHPHGGSTHNPGNWAAAQRADRLSRDSSVT